MARTVARTRSTAEMIRAAAGPALAAIVIANFAGYALLGSNGLFAWGDYKRQLKERSAELAQLQGVKGKLEHRNILLAPQKVDPDLADELVRKNLGLVRPDEVVVPLN